jgi:hypothetical protein
VSYFLCKFHGRDQQKRLTDAELELAAAKSKGYVSKYGVSSNGTATGHRLHAVVGVMTSFGSRSRREAIRKNLMPSGNGFSFADCFFGFRGFPWMYRSFGTQWALQLVSQQLNLRSSGCQFITVLSLCSCFSMYNIRNYELPPVIAE